MVKIEFTPELGAVWQAVLKTRREVNEWVVSALLEGNYDEDVLMSELDSACARIQGAYDVARHVRLITDYEHAKLCYELNSQVGSILGGDLKQFEFAFVPLVSLYCLEMSKEKVEVSIHG